MAQNCQEKKQQQLLELRNCSLNFSLMEAATLSGWIWMNLILKSSKIPPFCVKFKIRTNEKTSLPHGLHSNQPPQKKQVVGTLWYLWSKRCNSNFLACFCSCDWWLSWRLVNIQYPPLRNMALPIGSMFGIFTYIYQKKQPNVGKYTIHGSYGLSRAY